MCTALASDPSFAGIEAIANSWMAQNGSSDWSVRLGAKTLMDAVTYTCPEYRGLVLRWANSGKGGTSV